MPSADFTINGTPLPAAVAVSYGATVTLALVSTSGVRSVEWSIVGVSEAGTVAPVITPAGSPSGATATLTMPSDPGGGLGRSFLVQCVINGGRDDEGTHQPGYTMRGIFGAANSAGLVPLAVGEVYERDAVQGWTDVVNRALAAPGGGGGGLTPPDDPTDDGKIAAASSGDLAYIAQTYVGGGVIALGTTNPAIGAFSMPAGCFLGVGALGSMVAAFGSGGGGGTPAARASYRGRGTQASPTAVQPGDKLYAETVSGSDGGSSPAVGATWSYVAYDTPGSGRIPTQATLSLASPSALVDVLVIRPEYAHFKSGLVYLVALGGSGPGFVRVADDGLLSHSERADAQGLDLEGISGVPAAVSGYTRVQRDSDDDSLITRHAADVYELTKSVGFALATTSATEVLRFALPNNAQAVVAFEVHVTEVGDRTKYAELSGKACFSCDGSGAVTLLPNSPAGQSMTNNTPPAWFDTPDFLELDVSVANRLVVKVKPGAATSIRGAIMVSALIREGAA